MLKFEYVRVVFQRAKQIGMLKAVAFAIILFIILGQVATKFNLVRAVGLYPAQAVVGQLTHSTTPVYSPNFAESTFGSNNNDIGPNNLGFSAPSDTAIDNINHRMFIADGANNRVLVFNLNSENEIVDYQADYVLGQVDFTTNTPSTSQVGFDSPVALKFDEFNEYLYVSDSNNHRIMVFDVSTVSNSQPAINVIGQLDFDTAIPQTNESGLRYPMGIELDSNSSTLFVADWKNNRVMVFDVTDIVNGEIASGVLGQPDVGTSASGSDVNSLSEPFDIVYSSNLLYVSDSLNNRVLVFDVLTIDVGEEAVSVLGQPDFDTVSSGSTANEFNTPEALEIRNNILFVADAGNNRVLVFDVENISDEESAGNVLGQLDFTTLDFEWPGHSAQIFGSYFIDRGLFTGIYFNNNYLYVADVFANRIMVFNVASITDGESAVNILGFYSSTNQDVFGSPIYTQSDIYSAGASTNKYGFEDAVSVEVDTVNHQLFVAAENNIGRILVFNLNSENEIVDYEADYVLGQDDFVTTGNHTTSSGFSGPYDMEFDPGTSYLYVSDSGSDRVLVFDVSSITNNESAIKVLGQPDFTTFGSNLDQSSVDDPRGLSLDSENNLLYVADRGNNRVMVFDVASITDGESAVYVLGQPDFTTESGAATASKMSLPTAVSVDSLNQKLYVLDRQNFRVLVFDVSSIVSGESAVNVLGSNTFTDISSGTTASSFNFSSGFYELSDISINPNNQKLFVSDSGNNRVMVFDMSSIVDGEEAVGVIGQDDFTSATSGVSQTSLNIPKGMAIDSDLNKIFVVDSNNNRVLEFGFVEITTSSLPGGTVGSSYSQAITSSGFQGEVSYELYSGSLPTGISLVGDEITGTPTASGIYNFSIVAKDLIEGIGTFYSNPVDFSVAILGTTGGGGGGHNNDNILPLVEIVSPIQSQIFLVAQTINVSVNAADADGQISGVELFLDGVSFGEDSQIPYQFELSNLQLGNHTIYAIAYDDEGDSTESAGVVFTVNPVVPIGGDDNGPTIKKACSDGVDNDQDGATDFPNDLGCLSSSDNNENETVAQTYACSDGVDNDEDGFTDMGDEGCSGESDNNEFNQVINPDPEDEFIDPCEANPSVCQEILVGEMEKPKSLTNLAFCPPGLFNAATCITKESFDYTKEVLGVSVEQAWEIIDSPYGNSLTKTISVVSLIFGAVFTVLPVLFINPLSFSEILLIPVRLWSLLMSALGLKKKVRKWGVVYDSVTKRPLDPVYVSLQDSEGKEIASSITDLDGRYGFLVEPGQYRIIPKKTNYSFPSLKMVGKTRDEIYLDLYFGYVFEIVEQGGVIVKNIPMDPITFDWNEFTKKEKKLTNFYSKRDMFINKIGDFAFSLGFIMAIIAFVSAPIVYNILIFALYVGLMVFREIGFRQKKSGRVMRKGTDIPLAYSILRVFDFNTKTEVIQKVADKVGKFFCLVQKGEYYVTIESKEENGEYKKIFQSEKIKVKDGIIDNTFEV